MLQLQNEYLLFEILNSGVRMNYFVGNNNSIKFIHLEYK